MNQLIRKLWTPKSYEQAIEVISRIFPVKSEIQKESYSHQLDRNLWHIYKNEMQKFFGDSLGEGAYVLRRLQIRRCSCPCEEHLERETFQIKEKDSPVESWLTWEYGNKDHQLLAVRGKWSQYRTWDGGAPSNKERGKLEGGKGYASIEGTKKSWQYLNELLTR